MKGGTNVEKPIIKVTTVAFEEPVYRFIQKRAQEQNRSFNNYLETIFKTMMEVDEEGQTKKGE